MLSRRQLMNDKIVSAQGENLSLVNVKGSKLNALSVYGKSTQDGTPSPENPVPIVSAGDSGQINVNVGGKNLVNIGTVTFEQNKNFVVNIPAGTYTFSSEVESNDTDSTECLIMFQKNEQNIGTRTIFRSGRSSATITLNENANKILLYASTGFNESDGDTATFTDIQLEIGTVATAYEPYKTPQALTLSTPGGLPGIPVTSGGNYTDADGQQWICDEIDFKRGKYIQRVGMVELDGTEEWTLSSSSGDLGQPYFNLGNSIDCGTSFKGYSNYFPVVLILRENAEQGVSGWRKTMYLRWTELFSTVEDLKSFLSEKYTSGNPVRVSYILATPIETDLPAEEIADYQALHTYTPNTSVGNDAGAWMKVGYRERRR